MLTTMKRILIGGALGSAQLILGSSFFENPVPEVGFRESGAGLAFVAIVAGCLVWRRTVMVARREALRRAWIQRAMLDPDTMS